jgi:hypothetical protein
MKRAILVVAVALCAHSILASAQGSQTANSANNAWLCQNLKDGGKSLCQSQSSVTFTPNPQPKQPTAKGDQLVDGAIVCPSLDTTMWLYNKISSARVARTYMPPQNRQMVILQDGYDPWEEPRPSDYRCQLVPTGTLMNVKWEGGLPVVWGKMKDGRPFAGVTNPMMVDY